MSRETLPAGRFFALAVTSSWACWWLAVAAGPHLPHTFTTVLLMAGVASIAAAAVVLTYRARDAARVRAYWRSLCDIRRPGVPGLLAAALLFPAVTLLASAIDALATGAPVLGPAVQVAGAGAIALLKVYAFGLVLGPLLEELGWRGYALTPLQLRYGALAGALLLAVIHASWHLPLFFIEGSAQHGGGLLSPDFWRFMVGILAFDLVVAALFNATGASVLAAVVCHISFNTAATILRLTPAAAAYRDGLNLVLAILAMLYLRGRSRRTAAVVR